MRQVLPLLREWNFRRLGEGPLSNSSWSLVDLPHSPKVIDLNGRNLWFGQCEYRKTVALPSTFPRGRRALHLGAAMHSAIILVDGQEIGRHQGGYLPCEIDLTHAIRDDQPHEILIRLDNRDNLEVPPGKPFADLDFCWHGGLYRDAELRGYPEIYITDSIAANEVASGGLFIRTLSADAHSAAVRVQTHLASAGAQARSVRVRVELIRGETIVAAAQSSAMDLLPEKSSTSSLDLVVGDPALWQPDAPHLYTARVSVVTAENAVIDRREERFGIRTISFTRTGGFSINHRRVRLRGVNRHQEYPYVGYAVPPAAQRRDARRIKEAGFDYVRLSHYPQSPAFLSACDELGIVVMNCIPGWQFIGDEKFRQACFQNARELIRRDRNHPCVVLWELSLNETPMDEAFMSTLQRIGHEEYPGDQMHTCGWIDRYDVYIHARQHGEIHRWRNGEKALVVSEYGDWEFYASNQGFDQKTGSGLFADWSNARQLRADGERGLRQQVVNHLIALNDTLHSPAALDGLWSMFDYTRGYDANRAACGIMDVFRLPKFSYFFFRSQRAVNEGAAAWHGGPVIFIASYGLPNSELRVLVFSNCEEVELKQNGISIGRRAPDKAWMTQFLPHPPFVFELTEHVPGSLEATGYCEGRAMASHRVAAPAAPHHLLLSIDDLHIYAKAGEPDLLIAHAAVLDATGTLCVNASDRVTFSVQGEVEIVGPSEIACEAGIASVVLRLREATSVFQISATRFDDAVRANATLHWRHPASAPATVSPLRETPSLA